MTTMKDILDDQRARNVLRPAARRPIIREYGALTWASLIDKAIDNAVESVFKTPRRGPDTESGDHMEVYANVY